jgi:hypothetical protein
LQGGASLPTSLADSGDLDKKFGSFWDPSNPKNENQIYRPFVSMASRMIVGSLQSPLY